MRPETQYAVNQAHAETVAALQARIAKAEERLKDLEESHDLMTPQLLKSAIISIRLGLTDNEVS